MGRAVIIRRAVVAASVLALIPALAACTGGSTPKPTETPAGTDAAPAPTPAPTRTPMAIPTFGDDVLSYSTLSNGQLITRPGELTKPVKGYVIEGACSGEEGADVTYQLIVGDGTKPIQTGTWQCDDGQVFSDTSDDTLPKGRVSLEILHITKNATEIYLDLTAQHTSDD